jgi:hypothetical protein
MRSESHYLFRAIELFVFHQSCFPLGLLEVRKALLLLCRRLGLGRCGGLRGLVLSIGL